MIYAHSFDLEILNIRIKTLKKEMIENQRYFLTVNLII
jgi:hypothetical protein